jgi:hypothetical protein
MPREIKPEWIRNTDWRLGDRSGPSVYRARITSGPREGQVIDLDGSVRHLQSPEGWYTRTSDWSDDGLADFAFIGTEDPTRA